MSKNKLNSQELRQKRHKRVRRTVIGTTERPRLAVFRSNKHVMAQIVDDSSGTTLVAASTYEASLRSGVTGNIDAARKVGEMIAERAVEKGVKAVVFDRGGFQYHGRVAAVADGAREKGLEF
ncbi:MAG: 50S ribosomal protein L18 [Actinomycetota bacterium]|jgi:large subunit ribosomal protein L18|nr:50S ribosomal protein L18 [Actinomycetota bacterium]